VGAGGSQVFQGDNLCQELVLGTEGLSIEIIELVRIFNDNLKT
jgi:hypothetical protein